MIVGGVPAARPDHAVAMIEMALAMRASIDGMRFAGGRRLQLRIGVDSGPVVAGVIGTQKFAYDLWGDTANTASRMESHGLPGKIHVTEAVVARLGDAFRLEPRGTISVKGKGELKTWFVEPKTS
jgi:adenylate cyclase